MERIGKQKVQVFLLGEYAPDTQTLYYGFLVFSDTGKRLKRFSELHGMIVYTEVKATENVILWARKYHMDVEIFTLFEHVRHWADGEWNPKSVLAKQYCNFIADVRQSIFVTFSGNVPENVKDFLKKGISEYRKGISCYNKSGNYNVIAYNADGTVYVDYEYSFRSITEAEFAANYFEKKEHKKVKRIGF
jgi:hypothetical protein